MESKGPWVLYEMMPSDEHEASQTCRKIKGNGCPDEFLKDGQDGADGKKFERPLRDYLAIFRACDMHRTLFADRWESAHRDLGYLEAAGKEADEQHALTEKEKTQVAKELGRAKAEQAAVASLLATRQNMLKRLPSGRPSGDCQ